MVLGLAPTDFIAHMVVSTNYGYFRDELYYIEADRHVPARAMKDATPGRG